MSVLRTISAAILPDGAFRAAQSVKSAFTAQSAIAAHCDQIRSAFPDLDFERAKLITSGFANMVLILDDAWVFRFPRNDDDRKALQAEIRLLESLASKAQTALPRYIHVASHFAGYRMIQGVNLTPALFDSLDRDGQEAIARQIAAFLSALHALPLDHARRDGEIQIFPDNAEFSADYFGEQRKALTRKLAPGLIHRLDRFHETFRAPDVFQPRLIHGDLDDHHLLWDGRTRQIGVIDFGQASAGDPALDFALLRTYPEWVAPCVFAHYTFHNGDDGLLARARRHAVRLMVARLWHDVRHEGVLRPRDETIRILEAQLAPLDL